MATVYGIWLPDVKRWIVKYTGGIAHSEYPGVLNASMLVENEPYPYPWEIREILFSGEPGRIAHEVDARHD